MITRRGFIKHLTAGASLMATSPVVSPGTSGHFRPRAGKVPSPQEVQLFNGRDLTGWGYFLVDEDAQMSDVWSVEDGILICKGEPGGYLATQDEYESFKLIVEWRWPEEPGNSGVLMRIAGDPAMLPSSVEAQLRSGSAGDMYGFQGFKIGGEPDRLSEISIGWSLSKMESNENEPGEWNRYEITADGERITVMLNGKKVNEATGCDVRPGKIGLQSEGGVIHFRTVTLTPLPAARSPSTVSLQSA
jgi:hypothetical protein